MASKINNGKEYLLKEAEMLLKLLADELLLALKTKNAKQKSVNGRHSKKTFFEKQQKELKTITEKISSYIARQNEMANDENFIKLLLAEHENIIIYYRDNSSRIAGELQENSSLLIKSILEKHEKMAWALRVQLK